jgi:uncharacterized protein (TIGR03083 family)
MTTATLDLGTAYLDLQGRVLDATADPAVHEAPVPACPEWSVRDVVGHVAGLAHDAVAGELPSLSLIDPARDASTRDGMTDDQVRRSRSLDFADIVEGWRRATEQLTPMLRGETPFPSQLFGADAVLVTDLWVHDSDIRGALGLPRPPEDAAMSVALASYGFLVAQRIGAGGLAAIELRYAGKQRVIGKGEPAAAVTADRYELVRMLAGRRSRAQIAAMEWTGDPTPYLALIPAYGERADDLID